MARWIRCIRLAFRSPYPPGVAPSAPAVAVVPLRWPEAVRAQHARFLVTNMSGTALVRIPHVGARPNWEAGRNERGETVPLAGSVYEEVLFSQRPAVSAEGDGWLVPVTERGDALGLLELSLPAPPDVEGPSSWPGRTRLRLQSVAVRRHTDVFEDAQRDIASSIPAEMQRRLLPPAYTAEVGPVSFAAWLEPAHDVGGDTFDYSLDRDYLFVSITDAMGHSTPAALLATLTVAALRNARRRLAGPAAQADRRQGAGQPRPRRGRRRARPQGLASDNRP